ncbi:hypothetical protein COCOR_00636 [Corallococcus coralloides DSM 2259]|uniref:Uncharacterized protein n=1 Tax=Corallococcus coralloides (strain ATCC 25202 / DSM 2259 / NBRC 100086 / M2) TaxID=1144275 RepID=H8MG11_CORCM|nr:hypothetical protein [Corallococcus coralloides]AFE03608.1 hypothetical protein COCOR_00636 [Corallococcus coralloides DSM 2259]
MTAPPGPALLAVDLGLRCGLARFGADGRLQWYRSQNFGTHARLKRAVPAVLQDASPLAWLVLEGGGPIADVWEREALRRALPVLRVAAEDWRHRLLYAREQRSGSQAKDAADTLARRVIDWSHAPRPTSLRHDAAEAILLGLWGALEVGWLPQVPAEVRR